MNKKLLILLAVPHVLVGAVAVWAAYKANELGEETVSIWGYERLEKRIDALEEAVEKLGKRIDAAEFKMIGASSSGDSALSKIEELDKQLRFHNHPFLEKDVKDLKDELYALKQEFSYFKVLKK